MQRAIQILVYRVYQCSTLFIREHLSFLLLFLQLMSENGMQVERRLLLEKLHLLSQQDVEAAALLERMQMENDALTNELERSQEVLQLQEESCCIYASCQYCLLNR